MHAQTAREMWQLFERYHAVVYFEPEAKAIYASAGLRGGWMGYFASRSAALGAAPADLVIATFYNFHPSMVRRAIPDAWRFSNPQRVLEARYRVADVALRRLLGDAVDSNDVRVAADLTREVALRCKPEGRPLFAAHAALAWPSDPHLILWHAATLLREFRGDGHVAALTAHEIDGCEAHVLAATAGAAPAEMQREYRGWSEEEWADARSRLRNRGLLNADGAFTSDGRALHERIESLTDELALPPFEAFGREATERLRLLLGTLFDRLRAAVPYPNPMALTKPR